MLVWASRCPSTPIRPRFYHKNPLLSHQFPKATGREGEGRRTPSVSLACFNHGPMWTPTKEPRWNHRLLLCCQGSHRGCERPAGPAAAPAATAGLCFICFGDCFIPGKVSSFPGWYTALTVVTVVNWAHTHLTHTLTTANSTLQSIKRAHNHKAATCEDSDRSRFLRPRWQALVYLPHFYRLLINCKEKSVLSH